MRIARNQTELKQHIAAARDAGHSIGFVPTMGALHDGHLSLIAAAAAHHRTVVLSIFVNPTQFTVETDFSSYPRDDERDLALAEAHGVDVVFLPDASEMYPAGFATEIRVDRSLTGVLEGAVRGPEHFDGVCTVVAKLLLAVQPDAAFFGEKDFQQLVVVQRMVRDLGLPVKINGCPTLREADGLARSSRNVKLSAAERERAAAVPAALRAVDAAVADGVVDTAALGGIVASVLAAAGLEAEYVAFVSGETLRPVAEIREDTVCALAVPVGSVRLIDNEVLNPPQTEGNHHVE